MGNRYNCMRLSCSGWSVPVVLLAVAYSLVIVPYKTETELVSCSLSFQKSYTLYSKRVVSPRGVIPAAVDVENGKITAVTKRSATPESSATRHVVNLGNLVISPGLIDIHVHMNEPGRVEWEGAETATMAAAAGGVTTLVDMPLNSVPTTVTLEAFLQKLKATKGKIFVDVGFWAGLVPENGENTTILEELMRAGALGLKSFMCPSGIHDFEATNATHFEAALPILAKYGRPLLVHAEVPLEASESFQDLNPRDYGTYLETRPPSWEQAAIQQLVEVAGCTSPGGTCEGAKVHIVHLADADSLALIKAAKSTGADLTVETCPHYLSFSSHAIGQGQTQYKCAPPIRSEENRRRLWAALKDGTVDMLSSDHSPAEPHLKKLEEGNFLEAWGGIAGLQFSLPATWTSGEEFGVTIMEMANWWSSRPAALANLPQKGSIEVGKDADMVVWDPEATFHVDENFQIFHKHKVTPYSGMKLKGTVVQTYVRGNLVYSNGTHAIGTCGKQILSLQ